MREGSLLYKALPIALLLAISGAIGLAQNSNSADVRGTVTDATGAVVPGVGVKIAESATPAAMYLRYGGPGLCDQFFETATPRLRKPTRSVVGICAGFNSWVR